MVPLRLLLLGANLVLFPRFEQVAQLVLGWVTVILFLDLLYVALGRGWLLTAACLERENLVRILVTASLPF